MAKTTKTEKVVETAETRLEAVTGMVRKGTLAYAGMFGMAYDRAQERFEKTRKATDGLFEDLVARGEKIEAEAGDMFKETRVKVEKTYTDSAAKVREVLPFTANDRVSELEAEIEALNKKIVSLSKKAKAKATSTAKTATKKVAKATETVAKDVAEKAEKIEKAA